mmetsp:Transcript_105060/g.296875  ORF Transcript_105060/g.296875 Transcript_105060/m.296875 type:complete len:282 (-) Transcript_105060:117-962(-)
MYWNSGPSRTSTLAVALPVGLCCGGAAAAVGRQALACAGCGRSASWSLSRSIFSRSCRSSSARACSRSCAVDALCRSLSSCLRPRSAASALRFASSAASQAARTFSSLAWTSRISAAVLCASCWALAASARARESSACISPIASCSRCASFSLARTGTGCSCGRGSSSLGGCVVAFWRCRNWSLMASCVLTRAMSSWRSKGLWIQSLHCSSRPLITVRVEFCADSKMMGRSTSEWLFRSSARTSRPLMPSIKVSMMTTSGRVGLSLMYSRQAFPLSASMTL